MVRAAYDLFCERGYLGTTISEVARQANVAVPTIYYTFGTKAALLEAATTSDEAFNIFFTHGVGILERVAPLVAALHGAAGDPEAAEVMRVSEKRRVAAYREAVRAMAGKRGGLRLGLTSAMATDILVVLFSADLYQSIRTDRGWSTARTTTFLRDLLSAQLLENPRRPRP